MKRYIATKDKKVIAIQELEWQCRREVKGIELPAYWTWLESITSIDENGVRAYDFSGENYEIHEVDVDVAGLNASGHISYDLEGTHYHLSWDGSSVSVDDDSLEAAKLGAKWSYVRTRRNHLLSETDWIVTKAKETGTNISAAWKTYRQELRDITEQSDPDNITWPTKPS